MNTYELRLHVSDRGITYKEMGVYQYVGADTPDEAKEKVKLGLCPTEFASLEAIQIN